MKVFYAFGDGSGIGNAVPTALQSNENMLGSVSSSSRIDGKWLIFAVLVSLS